MIRKSLQNTTLLILSLGISLGLCELGLRAVLYEMDYLIPQLIPHPVLKHAIKPGSGGHDGWGFRNVEIPGPNALVAIGDSQTYGVSAPAREAWPAKLSSHLGQPVYNLSLGGYGPPDYEYLIRHYAPKLEPKIAIIAFYFGNDLVRAGEAEDAPPSVSIPSSDPRPFGDQRAWLAGHSMLYQVAKLVFPRVADALRQQSTRPGIRDAEGVPFTDPAIGTVFTPELRFDTLDQRNPANQRGLEATKSAFRTIDDTCHERRMPCFYLLIPTKESVYWEAVKTRLDLPDRERVERLVGEEDRVRRALSAFLAENRLPEIDPLPLMRAHVGSQRLYRADKDGHPTGAGHAVIAQAVASALATFEQDKD